MALGGAGRWEEGGGENVAKDGEPKPIVFQTIKPQPPS